MDGRAVAGRAGTNTGIDPPSDKNLVPYNKMPKATIEEKETAPEADPEQPEPAHEVPEEPVTEEVPVKARAKPKKEPPQKDPPKKEPPKKEPTRKDAPKKTNLKERHTCGACGQEMSLHTALYGHKNCPGSVPPPRRSYGRWR